MKKKILFVFGTRPEAIKLAPLIIEMRRHGGYEPLVCNTEQQKEMSNQTLAYFNIESDYRLNAMLPDQTLGQVQNRIMQKLGTIYTTENIAATIVQGDTISAFCGALVSFYNKVPVFHVEAGLRSSDLKEPFPEEGFRSMIARIASLHFAPTRHSADNLIAEKINPDIISVTGNTVVDALYCLPQQAIDEGEAFFNKNGVHQPAVLVTVHRRENHGQRLDDIIAAIKILAHTYEYYDFVLPVHPNPNVKNKIMHELSGYKNIFLFPPLDYPQLVYLIKQSILVLTDSGGIQEEAGALGKPILVLRNKTERMESVNAGISELVGTDTARIVERANTLVRNKNGNIANTDIYGDGTASKKIVSLIDTFFSLYCYRLFQR